jgi:hypothetical protein
MLNKKRTREEWYTAPPDNMFEDLKQGAIKIWNTYDDEFGYATGKINTIKDMKNFKDNYAVIIGMFDYPNQCRLISAVELADTKLLINSMIYE